MYHEAFRHETTKSTFRPPRFVSCCNSLNVMYMDLVLGVYNKVLLQDSCVHEWPLEKFPHSQLCCRHIRPSPYNDSHCFAAPVPYDTRLPSSSTCSKYKSRGERSTALSDIYPGVYTLRPGHPVSKSQLLSKPPKTPEPLFFPGIMLKQIQKKHQRQPEQFRSHCLLALRLSLFNALQFH